jgi:hypothetical protein
MAREGVLRVNNVAELQDAFSVVRRIVDDYRCFVD